jgi:hypothetical protein
MPIPILATNLYIPPPRPKAVPHPHLTERLSEGLQQRLTLISPPAGFGKTTLVSEWVADWGRPVAWLSLDEGDNDPTRFLTYLVAALQGIAATIGAGVPGVFESPQPPSTEAILTASCWTIWLKKSWDSNPNMSRLSCCAHPSSTACAVLCVTPFSSRLLLPGRKRWDI